MWRLRVRPSQPTPGRPRGSALRTLRSVCREPAGPPERRSLRAASAARGQWTAQSPHENAAVERREARAPIARRPTRLASVCRALAKPGGAKAPAPVGAPLPSQIEGHCSKAGRKRAAATNRHACSIPRMNDAMIQTEMKFSVMAARATQAARRAEPKSREDRPTGGTSPWATARGVGMPYAVHLTGGFGHGSRR